MGNPKRKRPELNARQARFVAEYVKNPNGTQAALAAGFSEKGASQAASELLGNPKVLLAVEAGLRRTLDKAGVDAERVVLELARIGLSDIGDLFGAEGLKAFEDMPEGARRAIASVEVEELFDYANNEKIRIGNLRKVKLWSKNDALTTLAKRFGLLKDSGDRIADSLEALVLASQAKGAGK